MTLKLLSDGKNRRVLPHNLEAETSVLGGVLLQPKAMALIGDELAAADFYHPVHAAIYGAMLTLDAAAKPIDQLTVAEQLRASDTIGVLRGVGGDAYFSELTSGVFTVENLAYHARIVRGKANARRLIEAATEIAAKGYGDYEDPDSYLDESEQALFAVTQRATRVGYQRIDALMREAIKDIEKRYDRKTAITGVPTGFLRLDGITAGFQPCDLVVIGARPSMGKTALAMGAAEHAAVNQGLPCLIFSAEMSTLALVERLMCSRASIDSNRLRSGELTDQDWIGITRAASEIAGAPLWIDDSGAPTLLEIRAKARRWRADPAIFPKGPEQLGMVVIDYLQLVHHRVDGRDANREREVAEISRGLKALAKELRVPIVALCQLNRGLESRSDKRPMLSDLRESGAIEQDADVVAFIYRDEVYHSASPDKGIAEVIVAKQRNGAIGRIRLAFLKEFTRFENLSARSDDEEP